MVLIILTCTDHNIMVSCYLAADEAETLDATFRNDVDVIACASPLQGS